MSDKKDNQQEGKRNVKQEIEKKEADIKALKNTHVTDLQNLKNKQAEEVRNKNNELAQLRKKISSYRSIIDPRRWLGLGGKSRRRSRRGKKSKQTKKSHRK
jgi:peptidoglycan hydrolase CwlO-like protein